MSAPEKPASPSRTPYLLLGILCLGLGVVALLLRNRAEEDAKRLAARKAEFAGMVKILNDAGTAPQALHAEPRILSTPWTTYISDLESAMKAAHIDRRNLPKFDVSKPTAFQNLWDAYTLSFRVEVKQGEPLPAEKLISFLDRLETRRKDDKDTSFLKTTKLILTLEESNIKTAVLEMQYWIPRNEAPGPSKIQ